MRRLRIRIQKLMRAFVQIFQLRNLQSHQLKIKLFSK
jgi:hypothetical protein